MRRLAFPIFAVSLIIMPLIGAAGCETCDVCGTYYREIQAGETVEYIEIHSDGTCEWTSGVGTSGVGTWELHEQEATPGFAPVRTVGITDPSWGTTITYTLVDDVLIAPNGERVKKEG
jgi:hypothetical protein